MALIKFFMVLGLIFVMTFHSITPAHADSEQDRKVPAVSSSEYSLWVFICSRDFGFNS